MNEEGTDITLSVKWVGKEELIKIARSELSRNDKEAMGNVNELDTLKTLLSKRTGIVKDYIKLVYKGSLLSSDKCEGQLPEALWKSGPRNHLILIGDASELPPPPPRSSTNRVIDDLQTDGVAHLTHPAQITKGNGFGAREYNPYCFATIEVLQNLPQEDVARSILENLANDPHILAVLKKHKWRVGCLAEMFPEGLVGIDDVCILGLNKNKGEKILLRLRTDDLKGFRHIGTIRKTLYHELAHNEHGDHDAKFWALTRQVEKEVVDMDWTRRKGNKVGGSASISSFVSNSKEAPQQQTSIFKSINRLGGGEAVSSSPSEAAARAAYLRLTAQEIAAEEACELIESTSDNMEVCLPCSIVSEVEETTPTASVDTHTQSIGQALIRDADLQHRCSTITEVESSHTVAVHAPVDPPAPSQSHTSIYESNSNQIYQSVMLSLDESIANYLSLDPTAPVERLFQLRSGIEILIQDHMNSQERLKSSLELLLKIIGNAKTLGIEDPKYRQIKTTSAQFQRIINESSGALQVLKSAGFDTQEHEYLKLSRHDIALLFLVYSIVDTCLDIVRDMATSTNDAMPSQEKIPLEVR